MSTSAWLTTTPGWELFQEGNKSSFPLCQLVSQQLPSPQVFHVALMLTQPLWDSNVFLKHHGEVNPRP